MVKYFLKASAMRNDKIIVKKTSEKVNYKSEKIHHEKMEKINEQKILKLNFFMFFFQ